MCHSWGSIAAAAISFALSCANAQDVPNLGDVLANQTDLSTFYGLIQKYPQVLLQLPSYQGVTVLAPSNDAFSKIPYSSLNGAFQNNDDDVIIDVLEYHILQGTRLAAQLVPGTPEFLPTLLKDPFYTNVTGGQVVENVKQAGDVVVFVSGQGSRSTLTTADLKFDGGVVQIIDTLLIPPTNLTDTTNAFNLTAFEGALYAAGIIDIALYTPNVTIFVSWNEGFQALGPAITGMTSQELAQVLKYTILPQVVYSPGLTNDTKFLALNGENITIMHNGNNLYVNSAQLLTPDILIANGVIHVIDNVLNPQGPNAQPNPRIGTQAPVFASASMVTNLPFTNSLPCTVSCPVTTTSSATSSTGSSSATGDSTTTSASVFSSSSRAQAAVARETGFGAAGLVAALGGALLLV
ncbi:hypothetical protein OIDMADRAFT_191287 [Oidiodendron maius Zn]|uniref:FAS1 domain-containing protein n=1 Tax=Oidiodendron maius (strain Zn) TaxID=913774 RepID=A0A0C3CZA5_OIDMZ|nr:hypothetical protein OIDMADRAFT_191287 [Oidiodendron maius Zn]